MEGEMQPLFVSNRTYFGDGWYLGGSLGKTGRYIIHSPVPKNGMSSRGKKKSRYQFEEVYPKVSSSRVNL